MQHVARVLDAVFGRLFWRGESVVAGAVEVLEAARAVIQLIALTRHDSLLLGHAVEKGGGLDLTNEIFSFSEETHP